MGSSPWLLDLVHTLHKQMEKLNQCNFNRLAFFGFSCYFWSIYALQSVESHPNFLTTTASALRLQLRPLTSVVVLSDQQHFWRPSSGKHLPLPTFTTHYNTFLLKEAYYSVRFSTRYCAKLTVFFYFIFKCLFFFQI